MPTFDTPGPISVSLEIGVGDIRIVASDRGDTVVEVRPSDSAKKGDVTAAEQTRVEFAGGRLLIKAPKTWRRYTPRGGSESIDIEIALPAGSNLRGESGLAALQCSGRLGECRYHTGLGDIQIDEAGPVVLKSGAGEITVQHVAGDAEVSTGTGVVRMGRIDGAAVIKNSSGDTALGEVSGDLRVSAASGRISVDSALATVAVKTAYGDINIGEVAHGAIVAQTAYGKVGVGIREGVAAWLDLNTGFGNVINRLDAAGAPEPGQDTVEVRARSSFGDITIRRAAAAA
jgi:putative adhesin